jgi:hypothetical protein
VNQIWIIALVGMLAALLAFAESGEVSKRISGCDYYMVDAPSGYAVLEWFGGSDPDEGDSIVGRFKSYGMHAFFLGSSRTETRAYVEDWGLSEDDALEKLPKECD